MSPDCALPLHAPKTVFMCLDLARCLVGNNNDKKKHIWRRLSSWNCFFYACTDKDNVIVWRGAITCVLVLYVCVCVERSPRFGIGLRRYLLAVMRISRRGLLLWLWSSTLSQSFSFFSFIHTFISFHPFFPSLPMNWMPVEIVCGHCAHPLDL